MVGAWVVVRLCWVLVVPRRRESEAREGPRVPPIDPRSAFGVGLPVLGVPGTGGWLSGDGVSARRRADRTAVRVSAHVSSASLWLSPYTVQRDEEDRATADSSLSAANASTKTTDYLF